jgi:hypothetical protein
MESAVSNTLVRGEPPGGGRRDLTVTVFLIGAALELLALVGDGPAATAAGATAWALLLLVELAER